ncbi:oligosaccharide flippase family protein [Vibrio sp. 10N.222.52.B7]|uniref:oligosaccharide flippase family protein n=1 Tax=Vibrio sp. 10N.222.52.B7 TaxID=3229629 RepID=UPI00354DAB9C
MKKINKNFKYLTILNLCTLGIPLITYPLMTNTIGLDRFGDIIYVQSIVAYFVVFVGLGFNLSITKRISTIENQKEISKTFWNVIYIKSFQSIILTVPFILICYYLNLDILLCFLLYLTVFSDVLFPVWYYQGIQEMKSITVVNVIYRIVSLVSVLIFISEDNGVLVYALAFGVTPLFVNSINLFYITRKNKISLSPFDFNYCRLLFLESLPIFWGGITSIIKDRTNIILIGAFVGTSEVVIYDFIIKIISLLSVFFSNLTNAQFPEIAKNKSSKLFKKYFSLIFLASFLIYFLSVSVLYSFSGELVSFIFYSEDYSTLFSYLSIILFLLIPLRSISYQLGLGVLISNGYSKDYSNNLMFSSLLYILFSFLLYCFDFMSIYTICLNLVITVVLELLHRVWLCRRRGVLYWII